MKTLALLASGSAGDVLPLASLASALVRSGYRVRLAVPRRFAAALSGRDFELAVCLNNPSDLLSQSADAPLSLANGLVRGAAASLAYLGRARPVLRGLLDELWRISAGADGIVVSLPSLWAAGAAIRRGLPWAAAFLQPFTPSREYPAALLPLRFPDLPPLNRLGHALVRRAIQLPWAGTVADWAREILDCPPRLVKNWYGDLAAGRVPAVYGLSPRLFRRPSDWPDSHRLSGFWQPGLPPGWRADRALLDFLADGPPPLYAGFGSVSRGLAGQLQAQAARMAGSLGCRIILAAPGLDRPRRASALRLEIGQVPHGWLFPRLAGVLHHGGAGTTAAALAAGIPQAMVPTSTDHFFWAGLAARHGCGCFSGRIEPSLFDRLLNDRAMREKSSSMAVELAQEAGPERAAGFLSEWFA